MNARDFPIAAQIEHESTEELRDGIAEWTAQLKAAEQSLKERDEEDRYMRENYDERDYWLSCGCCGTGKPCIEHKAAARLLEDR